MFSTDGILGRSFAISSAALDGLSKRAELHAQNIANADTDGYRAKTLDFESVLKGAISGDSPGNRFTNPLGGTSGTGQARDAGELASHFATAMHAGGKVDKVAETNAMMLDNIRYRVLTQQVTNQLSSIRSVIAEMGRG